MRLPLLKSKLAWRLMRLFVMLVAVPLLITVACLGRIGHDQMYQATEVMLHINQNAAQEAGLQFQQLERDAVRQSGEQTQATSRQAVASIAHKIAVSQNAALTRTARELSALTSSSVDGMMQKSLHTHHATLEGIRQTMGATVTRSAEQMQRRAGGNIERAMLALNATRMRECAQNMARQLTAHLQNAPVFLQFTAQMPDMRDGNAPGQKATLDALVRRLPEFLSVAALDRTGRETALSASDHLVTRDDMGDRSGELYFQQAMKGQTYMAVDAQPVNGAPVLRFAVPIEAYRGKIVGVVSARYSLESLWDAIRNTPIGQQGYVTVLDKTGRSLLPPRHIAAHALSGVDSVDSLGWKVVACVPREEAMQPIEALKTDIARNAQATSNQMQRDIQLAARQADGRLEQASHALLNRAVSQMQTRSNRAFQQVAQAGARNAQQEMALAQQAMVRQTRDIQEQADAKMTRAGTEASAQLAQRVKPLMHQTVKRANSRMQALSGMIGLVFSALGCLLALFTAGRIVRPILRLVSATQSIAEGELTNRVDEHAPDEIGDLAVAFNIMAARLEQSRTELNETEAQLVQSAKLASLGTLSAGVAHELNQPVAIIRGISQQLQDEPGLSEDMMDDLKLIEGQTSRMTKIIQHLRNFCRIGSADMGSVDVHDVVHNCFMFVGAQLQAHDVAVSLELGGETPMVMGDANELEQVFLNLITNARDAMAGRPDAKITIRTWLDAEQAVIEFADNGSGIPETVLSHIFDPFFTTKEPGKGTGLGLSISHNIIKKHNGQIHASNAILEGAVVGAVFTISLPLLKAEAQAETLAWAA